MSFHLGKPILVMIILAAICALGIALRPGDRSRADLVLWVFADAHYQTYCGDADASGRTLIESFEKRTGLSTDVQLIADRAQNVRLVSIFMSGMTGPAVPDLAEIEISSVGKYFRPPVKDVGWLPLNSYLENSGPREIASPAAPGHKGWNARLKSDGRIYTHDGSKWVYNPNRARPDMWIDRIIRTRFAPWSKGGVIFGVPHDVHPVGLVYRHDLFTEAGIDLLEESSNRDKPLTWPRFQELCLKFKTHWTRKGRPDRHPIELRTGGVDDLLVILLQRHLNLIDKDERIQFTDPKFVKTVAFYAQMVAGARKIGGQSAVTEGSRTQDLNNGNICGYMTPDWFLRYIKEWTATDSSGKKILEGKMRMVPLPIFEKGDARTGTWGGTMMGITRACPRPDDAWKLIEHIYLSDEGFEARLRETSILPPVMSQWDDPRFDRPDSFFGGQKVDKLYIELAQELPERFVSPATKAAGAALTEVMFRAIDYVNDRGTVGLEEACAGWLKTAAEELDRRIRWGKFE
jgi:arabinosaccharide transport system substrate-binding protein